MTRAEIRLELLRICFHPSRDAKLTIEIAQALEPWVLDALSEEKSAERAASADGLLKVIDSVTSEHPKRAKKG